jgi:hypothetical protein
VYHLEGEGIIWRGVYRLEGASIIWIIWKGRVSSGVEEYHLQVCVTFGRGGYHLVQESTYHLEGSVSS